MAWRLGSARRLARCRAVAPRAIIDHVREETNRGEPFHARGSRLVEFGSRSRPRQNHARRYAAREVQGLHGTREQRRATVRDQERHDGPHRNAQGSGAHETPDMNRQAGDTIFTIGHSTRTLAEFVTLLRQVDVTLLVDVRSIPWSRMTPQFNTDTMPGALAAEGIGYRHLDALGGRRHHRKGAPPSLNMYWRVAAFRNYADYAETDEFRAGLQALRELARDDRCAIMCAEAVWWRRSWGYDRWQSRGPAACSGTPRGTPSRC